MLLQQPERNTRTHHVDISKMPVCHRLSILTDLRGNRLEAMHLASVEKGSDSTQVTAGESDAVIDDQSSHKLPVGWPHDARLVVVDLEALLGTHPANCADHTYRKYLFGIGRQNKIVRVARVGIAELSRKPRDAGIQPNGYEICQIRRCAGPLGQGSLAHDHEALHAI